MQIVADMGLRAFSYATPLALAALGEMFVERTGLVNLGVEGMIALAASVSVLAGGATGNPWLGLLAGILAATVLALLFRALTIIGADQIVVGLTIVFLGVGLSDIVGSYITGPSPTIPSHAGITAIDALYPVAAVLAYTYLYHSWGGYALRSIGEEPQAAQALGVRVEAYRLVAVALGGILAGVAGGYIALTIREGKWFSGATTGWGWLALGVVILGYWHPVLIALTSYLVALLFVIEPLLAVYGVPTAISSTIPYLAVVASLAIVSALARRRGIKPPTQVWIEMLA